MSAGDFCPCHFCLWLWGEIIHSLAALADTWTYSRGFAEAVGVI